MARRVEFALFSTRAIDLDLVQVQVDDGVVTLGGVVRSRAEKLLAERTAREVEGVRQVVNNLQVMEQ